jgi:hypothetical protein
MAKLGKLRVEYGVEESLLNSQRSEANEKIHKKSVKLNKDLPISP